jgi:hypothetical protein
MVKLVPIMSRTAHYYDYGGGKSRAAVCPRILGLRHDSRGTRERSPKPGRSVNGRRHRGRCFALCIPPVTTRSQDEDDKHESRDSPEHVPKRSTIPQRPPDSARTPRWHRYVMPLDSSRYSLWIMWGLRLEVPCEGLGALVLFVYAHVYSCLVIQVWRGAPVTAARARRGSAGSWRPAQLSGLRLVISSVIRTVTNAPYGLTSDHTTEGHRPGLTCTFAPRTGESAPASAYS